MKIERERERNRAYLLFFYYICQFVGGTCLSAFVMAATIAAVVVIVGFSLFFTHRQGASARTHTHNHCLNRLS